MSRLTTAQVISSGQYLEPDFDPASLTVSQLLGVLGYHNVKYSTPYSKSKLVQLFSEEIKTRSAKFKRERLRKENSTASDEGIMDGLTGKPLATRHTSVRRSSRRLSQAPNQMETPPARQESPKRRRSSAQPQLAGSSKAVILPLLEESESEESPARNVIKGRKSNAVSQENRRLSQLYADDSGWEDNNIFQSGAEDSSPVRSPPVKPRVGRGSNSPRKSRMSSSAPPQILPFFSPIKNSDIKFPQSKFKPELYLPVKELPLAATPNFDRLEYTLLNQRSPSEPDEANDDDELTHSHFNPDIRTEASKQDRGPDVPTSNERPRQGLANRTGEILRFISVITSRLFVLALLIVTSGVILEYKSQSATVGYCERGKDSNVYLDAVRAERDSATPCGAQHALLRFVSWASNKTANNGESCSLIAALPSPQRCMPCPEHATCSQYGVACDTGYIPCPHPLLAFLPAIPSPRSVPLSLSRPPIDLFWKMTSIVLDGLPGLGSVAFPPRCLEDPKRKRNIGALGKAVEGLLGQERGLRLCAGGKFVGMNVKPEAGGEAKKWGVELGQLRETMRKKTSARLLTSFDDTFDEAIRQLVQWGNAVVGEDQDGKRYLAHGTPHLTLTCTLIVKLREAWEEWRATVFGVFFLVLLALVWRAQRAQRKAEAKRVAELVQTALNSLRNQEIAHYTDPITVPQPFLSSLQLRDLILQDEHSIPIRKRLWDQVERVVEENANVRVNLQEVQGGDEMRVWRWVGSAGQTEGARTHQKAEP
ncbi:hypothetical protein AX15_003979 [Amanita polypyramis BW_CC]|nr:hypothetical protein AX15_003979 [Amanita polypyramis BW_CC]